MPAQLSDSIQSFQCICDQWSARECNFLKVWNGLTKMLVFLREFRAALRFQKLQVSIYKDSLSSLFTWWERTSAGNFCSQLLLEPCTKSLTYDIRFTRFAFNLSVYRNAYRTNLTESGVRIKAVCCYVYTWLGSLGIDFWSIWCPRFPSPINTATG